MMNPFSSRTLRTASCITTLMILSASLVSCQLFAVMAGANDREPLYKIPSGSKVLVFVDVRSGLNVSPDFSSQLGQKIADQLYRYQGADRFVPQARLTELRRDADAFARMKLGDIARAADADVIIHVDMFVLNVSALSDESITEGSAQALVKVVDKNGNRLWPPTAAAGAPVQARVEPALSEQRDPAAVLRGLTDVLTARIGRMFHKWSINDSRIAR